LPGSADAPREHPISTTRTARYFTLGAPAPGVDDLWIVCHGYGQLASAFITQFTSIVRPGRLIVAPEALSRFYQGDAQGRHERDSRVGASWMTREDRLAEIGDYVRYLDQVAAEVRAVTGTDAPLRILGFSQGVSTAVRWVLQGEVQPAQLILWAGDVPQDVTQAVLGEGLTGIAVDLVSGDRDRLVSSGFVARQQARLVRSGIDASLHRFDGGHRLDRALLERLASGPPVRRTG